MMTSILQAYSRSRRTLLRRKGVRALFDVRGLAFRRYCQQALAQTDSEAIAADWAVVGEGLCQAARRLRSDSEGMDTEASPPESK